MQEINAQREQTAYQAQYQPGRAQSNAQALLARIFGCWHRELSRPFTRDGETYRTCVGCGAHRRFDPQAWKMVGAFYYAGNATKDHSPVAAVTKSGAGNWRHRSISAGVAA